MNLRGALEQAHIDPATFAVAVVLWTIGIMLEILAGIRFRNDGTSPLVGVVPFWMVGNRVKPVGRGWMAIGQALVLLSVVAVILGRTAP